MVLPDRLLALRRAVEYGKEKGHGTLIVNLELLDLLLRGELPVGGNQLPPEEVTKLLYDEKRRRIYYQDIVYYVCNRIDQIRGFRVGHGIVCGTAELPSRQVQDEMDKLAKEAFDEQAHADLAASGGIVGAP